MHQEVVTGRRESERRCVVCRTERRASGLVRLGLADGVLVPTVGVGVGGRGAHVCAARSCLEGLTARALSRVLRANVGGLDVEALISDLHRLAERRVLETIGLARRQGCLDVGVESVMGDDAVIAASDLSERSSQRLSGACSFVTGETIGRAAGMGWVGAARIASGRLADRAAYWLTLWYETRSLAEGGEPLEH